MSLRERLDSSSGGSSGRSKRSEYRAITEQLREAQKKLEQIGYAEEFARRQAELDALTGILRARVREPVVWEEVWAPQPFESASFEEPAPTAESVAAEVGRERPLAPVVAIVAVGAAAILYLPRLGIAGEVRWQEIAAPAVWCILGVVLFWVQARRRTRLRATRLEEREQEHRRARAAFEAAEVQRREEWEGRERARARILAAPARGNAEALGEVLEAELANEELPVPLVFEIEFEAVDSVQIELTLPDLDEVPTDRYSLTKAGRLSSRPFAQRDRVALYADLCAGLVLRVVYETLRVLPAVEKVEVFGVAEGIDGATGHAHEFIALHLATTREVLGRLDLEQVDPSEAIEHLGGQFSLKRSGSLEAIEGLTGLGKQTD